MGNRSTGLYPPPSSPYSRLAHSLHHRMPTGREVVFVAVDEGYPEVEEQVDEKRPCILCQEDLEGWRQASHTSVANGREG